MFLEARIMSSFSCHIACVTMEVKHSWLVPNQPCKKVRQTHAHSESGNIESGTLHQDV